MLRDIFLHGRLADMYGSEVITADANTPYAVISALNSRYKGFKDILLRGEKIGFLLKTGDEYRPINDIGGAPLFSQLKDAEEVHLMATEGGSYEALAAWIASYGVSQAAATFIATVVINTAISIAISYIASSLADKPGNTEGSRELKSFFFDGPVNLQGMGHPIPLVYGRFMCGSVVIGADVTVEQGAIAVDNYTTVMKGESATGNVLDDDILGSTLTITSWTLEGVAKTLGVAQAVGSNGSTVELNADGSFEVIADEAETGPFSIMATYTATDGTREVTANWKIEITTPYEAPGGGSGGASAGADGDGTAGDG